LIALGLVGFHGTGSAHPTALIPTWFGVALGIGGWLAISPNESRRKLFMHINVTIGLVGFLGAAIKALSGYLHTADTGINLNQLHALLSQFTMAALLLIYVLLCVYSFIDARRSGKV
jgi:hypothetical protein